MADDRSLNELCAVEQRCLKQAMREAVDLGLMGEAMLAYCFQYRWPALLKAELSETEWADRQQFHGTFGATWSNLIASLTYWGWRAQKAGLIREDRAFTDAARQYLIAVHEYTHERAGNLLPGQVAAILRDDVQAAARSREIREHAGDGAGLWIRGKDAADVAGVSAGTIGRNAGPAGSGKPILDNGKTDSERRFDKTSVADYAASRNQQMRVQDMTEETDAEVQRKMQQAENQ